MSVEWIAAFLIGCATGFSVAAMWYQARLEKLSKRIDQVELHRRNYRGQVIR